MIGSVVSGLAPSMTVLILGRAIQGLGAGGLIPLAMAVIGDLIAPRERGKWQGLTGAVFGVASVVGPATGGWISDNASWRWAFFVSLPFGLLALVVVQRGFTMEPSHQEHSIDYTGAALLSAGLSTGLLATVWGGTQYPWGSPEIVGMFAVSALLLVVFVVWERRAREPILPLELFRNRTFAASQVALFFIGAAMFGTILYVPLFVQGVLGESATSSGAILTPLMLALIGASVASGQLISRTGRYKAVLLDEPRGARRRVLAAVAARRPLDAPRDDARHDRRRARPGPRHLDLRPRRPERRPAQHDGGRDREHAVLPHDRRDDRGHGDGRDADEQPPRRAGRPAFPRAACGCRRRGVARLARRWWGGLGSGRRRRGAARRPWRGARAGLRARCAVDAARLAATVFVERRELRRSVHEGPAEPGRALFDELGEEFLPEEPASAAARAR